MVFPERKYLAADIVSHLYEGSRTEAAAGHVLGDGLFQIDIGYNVLKRCIQLSLLFDAE